MRAYEIVETGGRDVLQLVERPDPSVGPTDVLVRVRAAGVNRADILMREGRYPLPTGDNRILGLEAAGEVVRTGTEVVGLNPGDRVFGLVRGGGYADLVAMDMGLAVLVPEDWDWPVAAAVIEAYCTAGETLFEVGRLCAGESVLVHAAGSSVGLAAVQMARAAGARIWFTAGSEEKIRRVAALCGGRGINYRLEDFVEIVRDETKGDGVNVIEDLVGEPHFERNIEALAGGGRMVMVGQSRCTGGQACASACICETAPAEGIYTSKPLGGGQARNHEAISRELASASRSGINVARNSCDCAV